MTNKQPANNKQKPTRRKRRPPLDIATDMCVRITRSKGKVIILTLENNSEYDIWKIDMHTTDIIRRDQIDSNGTYLIFTPIRANDVWEMFFLPEDFFEYEMTIMFDVFIKKGAEPQKFFVHTPTLGLQFPKRPGDHTTIALVRRADEKTLKQRLNEWQKEQMRRNEKPSNSMKEQWIEAAKQYHQRLQNATMEERHQAMVRQESVAEDLQQKMVDLDYSMFYNAGMKIADMTDSKHEYRKWLYDWGLSEPDKKPDKPFDPYQAAGGIDPDS